MISRLNELCNIEVTERPHLLVIRIYFNEIDVIFPNALWLGYRTHELRTAICQEFKLSIIRNRRTFRFYLMNDDDIEKALNPELYSYFMLKGAPFWQPLMRGNFLPIRDHLISYWADDANRDVSRMYDGYDEKIRRKLIVPHFTLIHNDCDKPF